MNFIKTDIEGLIIIQPEVFTDDRGYFFESYSEAKFQNAGIMDKFVQDNESKSMHGVVRGLHFQKTPFTQAKLVRVIKGAVRDVAVDLRKKSPTYGKYIAVELTGQNKTMLYIPVGFAHGFATLEDDTVFSYKCSALYNKQSEGSLIWNDLTLNIDWGLTVEPIISDKDNLAEKFEGFVSPF